MGRVGGRGGRYKKNGDTGFGRSLREGVGRIGGRAWEGQ